MPTTQRVRSLSTLIAIVLFAVGVVAAFLVAFAYGGDSFWPGLIAGFLGTLVAFVLALNSARERDRLQLEQDVERERVRLAREVEQLEEQRATEIRRRLKLCALSLRRTRRAFRSSPPNSTAKNSAKPWPRAWWSKTVWGSC